MATKTLLSLADYAALPEDGKRYELVKGELVELTFPNWKHSSIQAFLFGKLSAYLDRDPVGKVGNDFGFILGRDPDTLRGPDLYFVTTERASHVAPDSWMEGAPNLAVEIMSPSNSRVEIDAKVEQYLAAGADLVWVVDPEQRTIETIGSSGKRTILTDEDELTSRVLLPDFSVSVRDILDA